MRYEIRNAIRNADTFVYNDEVLESKMMSCYADDVELGEFASDSDAVAAAEELQKKADDAATAILEAELPDACLEGGPCYISCLWRLAENDDEDDVKVEI